MLNAAETSGSSPTLRQQFITEYNAFREARTRCSNPRVRCYKNYGARGIKFLFTDFEQFFRELGPRPEGMSLDRKDNDGNYEPGNVHWPTSIEQARNKRQHGTLTVRSGKWLGHYSVYGKKRQQRAFIIGPVSEVPEAVAREVLQKKILAA
jgi:hypothetical protein